MFSDFLSGFRDGNSYNKVARYAGIIGVALLFLIGVGRCYGQSLTGNVETSVEVWSGSELCYQNRMDGRGSAEISFEHVSIRGGMGLTWWGACDAKAAGSFLNAEAGKVISRDRFLSILGHVGPVSAGVKVYREGVHHIWRNDTDRYSGFPPSNDWRVASRQCQMGINPPNRDNPCPTIGYFDRLGPTAIVRITENTTVQATYLIYQWKENTLPPVRFFFTLESKPTPNWIVEAEVNRDLTGFLEYDAEVQTRVSGPIWLGVTYGRLGTPGWRGSLERFAATVTVQN